MNGQNFLDNEQLKRRLKNNELEVSVFGRGFGECIVVGWEGKDFIIIDSFLNPETNNPIALDYLESIGAPLTAIKAVVLTHWHQDHISGISQILSSNNEIKLVLSPIFSETPFLLMLSKEVQKKRASTNEFVKIVEFIRTNKERVQYVTKDCCIYYKSKGLEIITLSPSYLEMVDYLEALMKSNNDKPKIAYDFVEDNMLSIVLLIKQNKKSILLGSDLEVKASGHGWECLVEKYTYKDIRPSLFKVPHHGSITGHYQLLWDEVLENKPTAVLTVYNKGKGLPQDEDIKRIMELSEKLFVVGARAKKDKEILMKIHKTMPDVSITVIQKKIGLLRYRFSTDSDTESYEPFGSVETYNF